MNFDNKRVLITGSTRSLGLATAQRFLELGARVVINGRTQEAIDKALAELDAGDRAIGITADMASVENCQALAEGAINTLGGLDVLVNCAGISVRSSLAEHSQEDFDRSMAINVRAPYFLIQASEQALRESKGNIVNVASDAGLHGVNLLSAYCASKAALVNLTRALAYELAPDVRINNVCPGLIETDMVRDALADQEDPEAFKQAYAEATNIMHRLSQPWEIAEAICYLASDQAAFATGSSLSIDGGSTI